MNAMILPGKSGLRRGRLAPLCIPLAAAALWCALPAAGQTPAAPPRHAAPLPQIRQDGAVKHMFVDGRPFIMLTGELHNSSASGNEYMKPIWEKLTALQLNTVIGTVNWELLEPEEGKFDYALVDTEIQEARKRNMRLVPIWFATWKNAGSNYVPYWVKADPKRFPVMLTRREMAAREAGGPVRSGVGSITPLSEAARAADAKAFRMLMRHIREVDAQHTVIMMQVENESGLLGDSRDRSPLAEAAWAQQVPAELMKYLTGHQATLLPELREVWGRNGSRTSGTWTEVFGTDQWAGEVFMAWYVGRYLEAVVSAGKAELNIPMYANAWLGPQPNAPDPGDWPSGGPVARVHDVWRAAAPSLDLLAPDIYVPDFRGTCALYTRSGNPLFIPEARDLAGNLIFAFGRHSALGAGPFGVENSPVDGQLAQTYRLLRQMLPQLAEYEAAGKVTALLTDRDQPDTVELGGYRISGASAGRGRGGAGRGATATPPGAQAQAPGAMALDSRPFAMVINTSPDEFLFIGSNLNPSFAVDAPGTRVVIASKDEGRYVKGQWIRDRRLNGDEAGRGLPNGTIGMLKVRVLRLRD